MLIDKTGRVKFKMAASKLQLWPLSWTFRLGRKLFQLLPVGSCTPKTLAIEIVFLSRLQAEISMCHFQFWFGSPVLIFDFRSVASGSIPNKWVSWIQFAEIFPTVYPVLCFHSLRQKPEG